MHLVLDGYGGASDRLEDEALVYRFLDEYPLAISMTKISPPHVYRYEGRKPDDWGVSGFVLIAESHISVHTFPKRGYLNVDIFSCKPFEAADSVEYVKSLFSLPEVQVLTLDRGLEFSSERTLYGGMVSERVNLISSRPASGG